MRREGKILLNNEFAVMVSTNAPKKFWESALRTGKAIGDFGYDDLFDHAIYLRTNLTTKKTYLDNSWYEMTLQGFHNNIEIDLDDMLARKYIVPNGVIIYKK